MKRHWNCISITSDAMMMVCPSCEVTIDREGKIWHEKEVLGMAGESTMFLSTGENIEPVSLGTLMRVEPKVEIQAMVGKDSKKLYGIVIKPIAGGKRRDIYFHDIDRMAKILESMSE